jgi:asparagine synthase (glutamine-hydrolysing)
MCGFAGFLSLNKKDFLDSNSNIDLIKKKLSHRGPDFSDKWINEPQLVSFIHARLSIQDLSSLGNQPMVSHGGRYCIIYNGEIYNHLELRNFLKANFNISSWRGSSDTETLLSSFECLGIENTLKKCSGMFSIAIWDNLSNDLYLIRDRFGEKPLYFGIVQNMFVFASELKALKQITNFKNEINRDALNLFLRFAYVPSPRSIYDNIYKLEPGSLLKINSRNLAIINKEIKNLEYTNFNIQKWWDAKDVYNNASKLMYTDKNLALVDLEKALSRSIYSQLISDVPVGAFLSGGIDSSLIVSLLKKKIGKQVSTFTIGFNENLFDESKYAKKIAKYLETDHNELILSAKESLNIIPYLDYVYDEPFADSSQIPTILISQFAKRKITVALTGDGGDELFGGYNRYIFIEKFWNYLSLVPFSIRKLIAKSLGILSIDFLNNFNFIYNLLTKNDISFLGDKVNKFSHKMQSVKNLNDLYLSTISTYQTPSQLVLKSNDFSQNIFLHSKDLKNEDFKSMMMFIDTQTYLTDDILCKVDRASMSTSLETRVPFLDKDIVELAWKIPTKMKVNQKEGKLILKEILNKYLPRELTQRPKMGFGIPLANWLRNELRDWAEDLIDEKKIINDGYFNSEIIKKLWNEHQSKKRDWQNILWPILMFQLWKKKN